VEAALVRLDHVGYSLAQFDLWKRERLGTALLAEQLRRDKGFTTVIVNDHCFGDRARQEGTLTGMTDEDIDAQYDHTAVRQRMEELLAAGLDENEATIEALRHGRAVKEQKLREAKEQDERRLEISRKAAMDALDKPSKWQENVSPEYKARIRELVAEGLDTTTATHIVRDEKAATRKKRYALVDKRAPQTTNIHELIKWLEGEGWSSADARPRAMEILEKRRKEAEKQQRAIEKTVEEAPLELVEDSYEELLQGTKERDEAFKREKEEMRATMMMKLQEEKEKSND
jgi:hypothetical protein